MIQIPFTDKTKYINCPSCQSGKYAVSHLPIGTQTVWYCDRKECGIRFSLTVVSEDRVDCKPLNEKLWDTLVVLRSDKPVTLHIRAGNISSDLSSGEYFYNESTCPINYMSKVVRVMSDDGVEDPHGIFKFVRSQLWAE